MERKNALTLFCAFVLFVLGTSFHFFGTAGCRRPLPCPDSPVHVVPAKPCELPPKPAPLPTAKTVDAGAAGLFCYNVEGAMAIVERDSKLRLWVKETIAKCGQPERSDAGSPDTKD